MITINIDKAKNIAHDKRREARAAEFAPYDDIIAKRIPGMTEQEAEAARQSIRNKFTLIQESINNSNTIDELKEVISPLLSNN